MLIRISLVCPPSLSLPATLPVLLAASVLLILLLGLATTLCLLTAALRLLARPLCLTLGFCGCLLLFATSVLLTLILVEVDHP